MIKSFFVFEQTMQHTPKIVIQSSFQKLIQNCNSTKSNWNGCEKRSQHNERKISNFSGFFGRCKFYHCFSNVVAWSLMEIKTTKIHHVYILVDGWMETFYQHCAGVSLYIEKVQVCWATHNWPLYFQLKFLK